MCRLHKDRVSFRILFTDPSLSGWFCREKFFNVPDFYETRLNLIMDVSGEIIVISLCILRRECTKLTLHEIFLKIESYYIDVMRYVNSGGSCEFIDIADAACESHAILNYISECLLRERRTTDMERLIHLQYLNQIFAICCKIKNILFEESVIWYGAYSAQILYVSTKLSDIISLLISTLSYFWPKKLTNRRTLSNKCDSREIKRGNKGQIPIVLPWNRHPRKGHRLFLDPRQHSSNFPVCHHGTVGSGIARRSAFFRDSAQDVFSSSASPKSYDLSLIA